MGRPISVEDAQIAAIALTANLTLATRRPYVKIHQKKWNGVNLVDLYAPTSKNLEVGLARERYFKCGDMDALKEKIDYHLANPLDFLLKKNIIEAIFKNISTLD